MNFEDLLKQEEGKRLEFKRDLSSPKHIMQTVIAFANTAGGVILIGIEDGTKNVMGVENPLKEEERLSNLISDNISPQIIPSIELLLWRDSYVIKVEVYLSANRPHYLRANGVEDGVYVRVGSSNRKVDIYGVEEIRREVLRKPFDEKPLGQFSAEDLDFEAALEMFKPIRKLTKQDFETLKLVVKEQGRKVPTVAGMILFGKERELVFSDAWIRCGFFGGKDKVNVIDTVEIRDYPVIGIEKGMDFIRKHSNLGYEIKDIKRTETWSRPLVALREALINAVVHCDYSQMGSPIRLSIFEDRIEVENPGLLVSGLTIEEIQEGVSKLRNKNIGRVFKELRFVEQWGSGIQRIKENCRSYGLREPKFEEIGTHFRVTIYTEKIREVMLSEKEREILGYLKGEGMRTKELSEAMGLSSKAINERTQELVNKGLVMVVGRSLRDPKRKYVLTREGEAVIGG